MTDDVRNLLGGYATGTLTEEEKKVLFEAALHDDALFAALADEHALKELLEDGAVRAQLLRATEEPRFTVLGALREWFESSKSKALVATGAVLLAVIGFQQTRQTRQQVETTAPPNMAELRRPSTGPDAFTANQPKPAPATPPSSASKPAAARRVAVPEISGDSNQPKREQAPAAVVAEADQQAVATAAATPPPPPPASPEVEAEAKKKIQGAIGGAVGSEPALVAGNALRYEQASPSSRAASAAKPTTGRFAAAPAGAFQRAAGTSVTPLRYELLRRTEAGDFQAVPVDYAFVPGDVVRLRVSSTRNGIVGIASNAGNQTLSGPVVANTWTEVPPTGGFSITPSTEKLVVSLSPSEIIAGRLLDTTEARAKERQSQTVYLEIPIRQKKP
jgi:hypothetical protein